MKALLSQLWSGKRDLALVAGMIGIVVLLFTPIPSGLLDFLLILNVSSALLVLLITFFTDKPLSFSTFPSLLLITTLFRLALNISATRLILEQGDAGRVIGAIGAHVVGGNYVIGLVVFLILVVVQYVVVTNGAQRVAEVAARFTLDSMPGKQMSIDADMNMGLIDDREARRRRAQIEKEANFYGAMDGATKFVKGDAIAGIMIILIDIVGGLTVGMIQHGMSWGDAAFRYTLLTVGDGIVTQIPSLVIAVATGIIITRAATDAELGTEIARQVLSNPRSLLIVAIALAGLLALPGLPALPVALVLVAVIGLTWLARRADPDPQNEQIDPKPVKAAADEDLYRLLQVDPIALWLGVGAATGFEGRGIDIAERIANLRRQFALDFGFVLPRIQVRRDRPISEYGYSILLNGVRTGQGELRSEALLAINPGEARGRLQGQAVRDPAFGMPAMWIAREQGKLARAGGYTVVEPDAVLVTHLTEICKRHAAELLTRAEVERLIQRARERHATLVEDLVPTVMSYTDVQKVLQQLLREQVSILNLDAILEVLVDVGKQSKQTEELVERVRERLGGTICQKMCNAQGELHVLTLAPELERALLTAIRQQAGSAVLVSDIGQLDALFGNLAKQADAMMSRGFSPVLLCAAVVRRPLRQLLQRVLPHVAVVGLNEVPATAVVKAFGTVAAAA